MANLSTLISPMSYSTPGSPPPDPSLYASKDGDKKKSDTCATCKKPMPDDSDDSDKKDSVSSADGAVDIA